MSTKKLAYFMTKKQKKLMRERRHKKRAPCNPEDASTPFAKTDDNAAHRPSKRTRTQEQNELGAEASQVVVVDNNDASPTLSPPAVAPQQEVSSSSSSSSSSSPNRNNNNNHIITIVIPKNLSSKEAKKFRKDARRNARHKGQNGKEPDLVFVVEGQPTPTDNNKNNHDTTITTAESSSNNNNNKKKTKKRSFPRINDVLAEERRQAEAQRLLEERQKAEEAVSADERARYLALDCEMVGIGTGGKTSALARASITDWDGTVVLDTYVKVPTRVTDFRTQYSGITAKNIRGDAAASKNNSKNNDDNNNMNSKNNDDANKDIKATPSLITLNECRQKVTELLKDKILVGHALKNDLDALLLSHPKTEMRDTAKYRPLQRPVKRGNKTKYMARKLRDIALQHANLVIQKEGESHDSVDDARAAMQVYKAVRDAWERELALNARKK